MESISRLFGTFLLNSLWQVAFVGGVAAFCAWPMRNTPARYRHWLWMMALGLSLLLPLWSLHNYRGAYRGAPAPLLPQPGPPLRRARLGPPSQPRVGEGWAGPLEPTGLPHPRRFRLAPYLRSRTFPVSLPPWLADLFASCYLIFLLFRFARLWRAWRRTEDIRKAADAREIPGWLATISAECQVALGLANVSFLSSSRVATPLTLGLRRATIILPERLLQSAPANDLTAALCHEMAHIRRHDFLMNLICELLHLPISFHPVAMLLKRRIDETRELASDEMAAERLADGASYARSLLNLARAMSSISSVSRPGYTLGVFDADILEERIMRLLDKRPFASSRWTKMSLLLAAPLLAASAVAAAAFSLSVGRVDKTNAEDKLKPFLGTWQKQGEGGPVITLTLKRDGQALSGKLEGTYEFNGRVAEFSQRIVKAKVEGAALSFNIDSKDEALNQWEMRLTQRNQAELINSAGAAGVLWKVEPEKAGDSLDSAPGRDKGNLVSGPSRPRLPNPASAPSNLQAGTNQGERQDTSRELNEQMRAAQEQIQPSLEDVQKFQEEMQKLQEGMRPSLEEIQKLQEKIRLSVEEIQKLQEQMRPSLEEFRKAQEQMRPSVEEMQKLQEQMRPPLEEIKKLQERMRPSVEEMQKLQEQMRPSQEDIQRLQEQMRPALREIQKLQEQMRPSLEELQKLQLGQLDGLSAAVQTARSASSDLSGREPGAQRHEGTGSISGTVSDPSGARVPYAIVSLDDEESGLEKSLAADDAGEFSFKQLPPGQYRLEAESPGFEVSRGIRVVLGPPGKTSGELRVQLKPSSLMQTVDVTAKAPPHPPASAPTSAPVRRIRVGGLVQAGRLLQRSEPKYPESARAKGIQGTVRLEAVISLEGVPLGMKVLSSPDPELSRAAMDAVRQWRYEPTLLNGQPIEVVTTIAVRFRLEP